MKTILVPTDFSITADYAIYYAFNFATFFDASVILYHAFIPFESGFYPYEQSEKENLETERKLIKRLTKIKETLLGINKNISVSIHIDKGPESKRLVEFCSKEKVDIIVMGTTGASGVKEVVIGSFTADIMANAPCPVLAVPNKYKFKKPEKITFASDYHTKDSTAVKYLAELNCPFQATIGILHVVDREDPIEAAEKAFAKYRQKIERQCQGTPLQFQLVAAKDITEAILSLSQTTDILAISPVRRLGFLDRLLNRSVTKTIAWHIRVPLLSIPLK